MKIQEELLDKYYRGETSPEEERELKTWFAESKTESAEKDMFDYFRNESHVPDDLEESIYSAIKNKQNKSKLLKIRIISISSAAAAIVFILSIHFKIQQNKKAEMENNFLVMEKALFQVSESIQPDEQEEMFVIWVDNDIEIIIN